MERLQSLSHESDVDLVLEKYSVEELRAIEKKTRSEIERKKEELRSMVGERYREIIEAADSITDMKFKAREVKISLNQMQEMYPRIKSLKPLKSTNATIQHDKYAVASQIKLLLDVPEWVWTCVESGKLLQAAQLYLIANHVTTCLRLSGGGSSVLARQAAVVATLKPMLLQRAQAALCAEVAPDSEEQETGSPSDVLCALLLLQELPPRQALQRFLLARLGGITQLLSGSGGMSIKQQISSVSKLIMNTISDVADIFTSHSEENGGKLQNILQSVTTSETAEQVLRNVCSSSALHYLPRSVKDLKPRLAFTLTPVNEGQLHTNCIEWKDSAVSALEKGVKQLLQFVPSVKALTTIRDAVWNTVQEHLTENWDRACKAVLGKALDLWQAVLMPLFIDSAKEQVSKHLRHAFNSVKVSHEQLVQKDACGQCSVALHIWQESADDVPPGWAWLPRHVRWKGAEAHELQTSGLGAKAAAHLPDVCKISSELENSLSDLQRDLLSYLQPPEKPAEERPTEQADGRKAVQGEFHGGRELLCKHLNAQTTEQLQSLLDYFQSSSEQYEKSSTFNCAQHLLLLARLCRALHQLVPHLSSCATLSHVSSSTSGSDRTGWEPYRKKT